MGRILLGFTVVLALVARASGETSRIPILYSTDLFHPHDDPDDHYDLACLFALPEFDIKGIILDQGALQAKRTGRPAVEQMRHITGRRVPCAIGLSQKLRTRTDKALDEPAEFQKAVALILSVLRESKKKVTIFTTGSCRDVAAAFNREPDLLRAKVKALYFNIGNGPDGLQDELNVGLDPQAYLRLFESGLPLHWCPCFGKTGYETFYVADQAAVVGACAPAVQGYFAYCLSKSMVDPIGYLAFVPRHTPKGNRNMWCTAPMLHAAGRKVYQRAEGDFVALPPAEAEKAGLAAKVVEAFQFVPMRATIDDSPAEPGKDPSEPEPGKLTAAYRGCSTDRVGTGKPEPDGKPDCCVRILGVEERKPIRNIVLTGPREGRWEHVETGRWWRLVFDREGRRLDAYFQFYAAGDHRIEITFNDGTTQGASFAVPNVAAPRLRVELAPKEPNGFVFRATDPRYQAIMASCLRNLLATLGRAARVDHAPPSP
jgi:hypothetical protein